MKDCCTRDQQQLTDSNTSKIRYKIQADIFVLHKSYHWSKFCERTKYPPLFSFFFAKNYDYLFFHKTFVP